MDNSFGRDDTKVNIIYVGKQIFISICLYWKTLTVKNNICLYWKTLTLKINNRMQRSFLIDSCGGCVILLSYQLICLL